MTTFAEYRQKAWPYRYRATLRVGCIAGGIPTDPKVAEAWLRTKLAEPDDLIREEVARTMVDRGVTAEEATRLVDTNRHLNGFKRLRCEECPEDGFCDGGDHPPYIEGRQVKAMLKEAANVAVGAGKLKAKGWGVTNKGLKGFVAEHVFVVEDVIPLGVAEPDGIAQRFPHTFRGGGIQYEELVDHAEIHFTVVADYPFKDEEWAMIWLTAEREGIGASRSQGYGHFELTRWECVEAPESESHVRATYGNQEEASG